MAGEVARRGARLPALLAVLFAAAWWLLQALPRDPLANRFAAGLLPAPAAPIPQRGEIGSDPRIRSKLPLPGAAANPEPTIVLAIGECTLCALDQLRELDRVAAANPSVRFVAFAPTPEPDIRAFRSQFHVRSEVVSDTGKSLAKAYNASSPPRVYAVAANGSLAWVQRTVTLDPTVYAAALKALGAASKVPAR